MAITLALECKESEHPLAAVSHSRGAAAEAFHGVITPTPLPLKYKIGLTVVALGLVFLLLVYVGLIAMVAYGVYAHAVDHKNLLSGTKANFITLMVYAGPIVGGVVLIFFMVKPFLAGRVPEPDRYTLTSESDPVLFAFIARLCELVRAPKPNRVDVDCEVNASASFRHGLRSLQKHDVVLTIGLPLVQGLTTQQFAGVLAHEFGHFAQGAGMRLSYLVRLISGWFARVVYERDEWDLRLNRLAYSIDLRLGVFLHVIRFCIWLSRRVLWVLMHLGRALSGFMLRQMEFDADSYETKVAGSAAFAQTTAKLQSLRAAAYLAHDEMEESWRNRRLPENLPGFINLSIKNVTPELQKKADEHGKSRTGIFDTHPSDTARIRAAERLNEPGVISLSAPASELFNGFEALCKGATRFHYESHFGLRLTEHNLVSHEVAARESQSQAEAEEGLREFFVGVRLRLWPIRIPAEILADTSEILIQRMTQARQAMEQTRTQVLKANREYEEAEALLQRGLEALARSAEKAQAQATETMRALTPTLEAFETCAQTRLLAALSLLRRPEVSEKISEVAKLQAEADQLTVVLERMGHVFFPLQKLRRDAQALATAAQARSEPARAAAAEARVDQLSPQLRDSLAEIKSSLQDVLYPFQHPREGITIAEHARSDIPAEHKLEALFNNASCHVDRLMPLYQRVLGRLAFIALKVESVMATTHQPESVPA